VNIVLCTLFEGDYHLGAAALLNSLHRAGFRGTFVCGYRGARPAWADDEARLAPLAVKWIEVETALHFTNYKPDFMLGCLHAHVPDADVIGYLDPDIVVKAPWAVLARWLGAGGVALCEDVNASLPAGHPQRLAWQDFFERHNLASVRSIERYYNAGFVAVPRALENLLVCWAGLIALAEYETGSLQKIKHAGPHALFHTIDQDALNMALLLHPAPIHATGPEGMDFMPGGHLLSHAAGGTKPWRGGFLRAALGGRPPGQPQKQFLHYATAPLAVLPAATLAWRRCELAAAALLGRFYRRA
jgi:hypothetical protein